MDTVTISIVGALAAGAAAAAQDVASDVIKDAYAGLKKLIATRYGQTVPFAEAVEADPSFEPGQAVLAKQLAQAGCSDDEELKAAAQAVLGALESLREEPRAAALFDFEIFHALKNFEVEDAEILGTLFRAKKAVFKGDAKFKGLRQASTPGGNSIKH